MNISELLKFTGIFAGKPSVGFPGRVAADGTFATGFVTPAYVSASAVVIDASVAVNIVVINDGAAFTIAAPINTPGTGLTSNLTITISNTSGGALGAGTFNAIYKMTSNTAPAIANGKNRSFQFYWNGTNWIETSATAADVAN